MHTQCRDARGPYQGGLQGSVDQNGLVRHHHAGVVSLMQGFMKIVVWGAHGGSLVPLSSINRHHLCDTETPLRVHVLYN